VYRKIVTALTASLIAASVTAAPARAAEPSPFSCRYHFAAWPRGFSAELLIRNNGPAVDTWTAHWTHETPTQLELVWNARMTQLGPQEMVATPMPWNVSIPTNGWVGFGWTARATETEVPTDITINGLPC
jgi:Cellulose binding domain